MKTSSHSKFRPWFFFTAAFESLGFAALLFSIPSESGLSPARFGLIGILLLFFAAGIYLGFRARNNAISLDSLPRTSLVTASTLLALTSSLFLFLLRYLDPERLLPAYERLSPLLWFFLVFGIQSALFLLLLQNGFHRDALPERKPVQRSALIAFFALLILLVFVAVTKLGITRDTAYWGEPGVAILGWHFILAILAGFAVVPYEMRITQYATKFILPFAIWLAACILWLSVSWEVLQNSFYAPITPPANIPFPYSDAGFYDYLSQSLLIGADYLGGIPPRPLYVTFLAGLHALFGQNYPAIIAAQTLVLALFPVALYFLARKLHSPAAGVTVALFAIFREYLGLWISSNTRVVNSKMFTTDFPTALGIAVFCLVAIWWLERRDFRSTLIAGGAFGLLLLFRTQSLLVLPAAFVLAWFVYQRRTREWFKSGLVFAVAMTFTIAPWLIHNHAITGKIAFDDPKQMAVIYSQYSFSGNLDITQFDIEKESLGDRLLTFTLENPAFVAGFIANHFLNTEIGGLLSLPLVERFDGLFAPVNLYWVTWDGSLQWYNFLLVVFYLGVIAVGLGASWQRLGWLGLIPLAFNLGYALSNGISRFSSWRYNLPVDWAVYFYFGIGIVEIFGWMALLFGAKNETQTRKVVPQNSTHTRGFLLNMLIVAAFALVGALPWFAKGLAAPRYTASQEDLIAGLASRGVESGQVESFVSQPKALLIEGRMLYPRMYRRDDGMVSSNPWPAYAVRDYARLGFILIKDARYDAIFPTRDLLDFPQGADAVVLACQADGYLDVRLIAFPDSIHQSAPLTDPCD